MISEIGLENENENVFMSKLLVLLPHKKYKESSCTDKCASLSKFLDYELYQE